MTFNPSAEQQAYFDWLLSQSGNAIIEAVAGAGKSTTLVQGLQFMRGTTMLTAFNKKASEDLQSKVSDTSRVEIGTVHSFGFRLFKANKKFPKLDQRAKHELVCNALNIKPEFRYFYSQALSLAKQSGFGLPGAPNPKDLQSWIDLAEHHSLEDELPTSEESDEITLEEALVDCPRLLSKANYTMDFIDFDDMIYLPLLHDFPITARYNNALLDEAQDTNFVRRLLVERYFKDRFVAVGDPYQAIYGFCHPAGVMVKTPTGATGIQNIQVGDQILTSLTDGQVQGWNGSKKVKEVHRYFHSGFIIELNVSGRKVRMTPHHRVPVRIGNSPYYTYLMRRCGKFRVGYCKSFTSSDFMLTHRMKTEKADSVWILASHNSKEEAIAAEKQLLKRVKGVTFQNMSDDQVRLLFSDEVEALAILAEHGRLAAYPALSIDLDRRFSRKGPVILEACNLLDGMKSAFYWEHQEVGGKYGKRQKFDWLPIKLTREEFSGEVFGITIDPPNARDGYHAWPLYFANDVLVHNTGANNDSMEIISRHFNTTRLPLHTSFRCAREIVREAQTYVPHILSHPSAPLGSVSSVFEYNDPQWLERVQPGQVILCRNTKPLLSLCFHLIRMGKGAKVEGRKIGEGLKSLIRKFKWQSFDQLRGLLNDYRSKEIAQLKSKNKNMAAEFVNDKVECILALTDNCPQKTRSGLEAYVDSLFGDNLAGNAINLSTIHKAKGREWSIVYWYGPNKFQPSVFAKQEWELDQERNLMYVAATRAKLHLHKILLEA